MDTKCSVSGRERSTELYGVGVGASLSQRQNSTSCPRRDQQEQRCGVLRECAAPGTQVSLGAGDSTGKKGGILTNCGL